MKGLLENIISPAFVRPQNTPLSWIDVVEEDGRFAVTFLLSWAAVAAAAVAVAAAAKLPSPSTGLAPNANVGLVTDATTGAATLDRICGEVHIAADSKVDADELDLTASMRTTGFDGTCRRWMIQIAHHRFN